MLLKLKDNLFSSKIKFILLSGIDLKDNLHEIKASKNDFFLFIKKDEQRKGYFKSIYKNKIIYFHLAYFQKF